MRSGSISIRACRSGSKRREGREEREQVEEEEEQQWGMEEEEEGVAGFYGVERRKRPVEEGNWSCENERAAH